MKAAFSAVAYGWTSYRATRAPMPWVAKLNGFHPTHNYQRQFMPFKADHLGARPGAGTDVIYWWTLSSGDLYQARYLTGRRSGWVTRWMTVDDGGTIVTLAREEVDQCLITNGGLASMS